MERAHLIPNEAGGPGYKAALNLMATSQDYNDKMQVVENQISRVALMYANSDPVHDILDVRMEMTVTADLGGLFDQAVLAAIKSADWYKGNADVEAEIRSRLGPALNATLRRAMRVGYTYRMTLPGKPALPGFNAINVPDLQLIVG
jgi:hypothetical protein